MGDILVVGTHSDEEIGKHKGIPVMTMEERIAVLKSCKWVDEVIPDVPYLTDIKVVKEHDCDFCVHGDDIILTPDGRDCYAEAKAAGMYREYKRTNAISTTELVGRMLLATKEHLNPTKESASAGSKQVTVSEFTSNAKHREEFLPTCTRISQFSEHREPKPGDRIIYVDGDFDLFHAGHATILKRAKEMGDFLVVGIHSDSEVNRIKGANFPLLNLMERVLTVLSCRYVDEVIIGAPYTITHSMMYEIFDIHLVVHGTTPALPDSAGNDPYALPKSLKKYAEIEHDFAYLSTEFIVNRIFRHREEYEERNKRKLAAASK